MEQLTLAELAARRGLNTSTPSVEPTLADSFVFDIPAAPSLEPTPVVEGELLPAEYEEDDYQPLDTGAEDADIIQLDRFEIPANTVDGAGAFETITMLRERIAGVANFKVGTPEYEECYDRLMNEKDVTDAAPELILALPVVEKAPKAEVIEVSELSARTEDLQQFTPQEKAKAIRAAIACADKQHEQEQAKRKQELYQYEERKYVRIKDAEIMQAVRAVLSAVEQGTKPNVTAAFRAVMGERAGKIALDSTRLPEGTGRKLLNGLRYHSVVKRICTSTDSACSEAAYMTLQVLTVRQIVAGIIRLHKSAEEHDMLIQKVDNLEAEMQEMRKQLAALTASTCTVNAKRPARTATTIGSEIIAQVKALAAEGLSVRAIADSLGIGKSTVAKYARA